jgi:hypothetical protein
MVGLEFDRASKAEAFHTAVDKLWCQVDGQNQGEPAVRILEAVETKSTESQEISVLACVIIDLNMFLQIETYGPGNLPLAGSSCRPVGELSSTLYHKQGRERGLHQARDKT